MPYDTSNSIEPLVTLVAYIFACSGITLAVVYGLPFTPLRRLFTRVFGVLGFSLIYCPMCVSFWVGALWVAAAAFGLVPKLPGPWYVAPFYGIAVTSALARVSFGNDHPTWFAEVPPNVLSAVLPKHNATEGVLDEPQEEAKADE